MIGEFRQQLSTTEFDSKQSERPLFNDEEAWGKG